jgi:hypothetical protein
MDSRIAPTPANPNSSGATYGYHPGIQTINPAAMQIM